MRDPEQIEQSRRDLAREDVLRRVLAAVAAPGHDEQRGSPYMSESEASALRLVPSPEFCISTAGRRPANQAPRGQPDRDVFARGGDLRQTRVSLERRDQVFDQRARHPAKKSKPAALQDRGKFGAGHGHGRQV